jgi:hypothetical protein
MTPGGPQPQLGSPDPARDEAAAAGEHPFGPHTAQILATEHWSLLLARSLVWNEWTSPRRPATIWRGRGQDGPAALARRTASTAPSVHGSPWPGRSTSAGMPSRAASDRNACGVSLLRPDGMICGPIRSAGCGSPARRRSAAPGVPPAAARRCLGSARGHARCGGGPAAPASHRRRRWPPRGRARSGWPRGASARTGSGRTRPVAGRNEPCRRPSSACRWWPSRRPPHGSRPARPPWSGRVPPCRCGRRGRG